MARLDDAAKPILERLMASTGKPVELTPTEAEAVALWAYKISLVFEYITGKVHHDDAVRHEFYRTRAVPIDAAVALGATSFTMQIQGTSSRMERP